VRSPQKRDFLKRFLREKVKPLLDQHFDRVMEIRMSGEKKTCKEGLQLDYFQLFPKFETEKTGQLFSRCLCCAPAPYWHATTAFYHLFFPEIWKEQGWVAADLLSYFQDYGMESENFGKEHLEFLIGMRDGTVKNKFLTHPIEVCVALHALSFAQGEGEEREERMEKLTEEKIEELKEWEKEWEDLKK
jgi:hypothetical protein